MKRSFETITPILNYYPFGMVTPGRAFAAGNEYRYGFQGVEECNSLMDNSYLADFRAYNSKIGRWLSIDPLYKSYISNYSAFSNTPITRVDPRGDDDYFDIDGNFVGSDNKSTNYIWVVKSNSIIKANDFYIIQKDGSKFVDPKFQSEEYAFKPSDFYYAVNTSDPKHGGTNKKAISYNNYRLKKILGHYFVEPILMGEVSTKKDEEKKGGFTAAYYSNSDKQFHYGINSSGKISRTFDNVNDLRSAICDHEDIHKEDYKDPNFQMTFKRHADIYLFQIEADGFPSTTEVFQQGTIIGAVDRYFAAYQNFDEIVAAINNINTALKNQGINYQVTNVNFLGKPSYEIINTKTRASGRHSVTKPANPED